MGSYQIVQERDPVCAACGEVCGWLDACECGPEVRDRRPWLLIGRGGFFTGDERGGKVWEPDVLEVGVDTVELGLAVSVHVGCIERYREGLARG